MKSPHMVKTLKPSCLWMVQWLGEWLQEPRPLGRAKSLMGYDTKHTKPPTRYSCQSSWRRVKLNSPEFSVNFHLEKIQREEQIKDTTGSKRTHLEGGTFHRTTDLVSAKTTCIITQSLKKKRELEWWLPWLQGGGNGELLLNGYRIWVFQDEKLLSIHGTIMWLHLILSWIYQN